ncbi:FHA domain-containing protein [uncultured Fibrella sp.]|uniref:FHA domain-containing protein n=1 Tax=uncultured Fibrella sp. TaxID=1284596 RepID=UPI0035C9A2FF
MAIFKTTLVACQQCGRKIMVRPADAERGTIVCSHVGCSALNTLNKAYQYDPSLAVGLPAHGRLTYLNSPVPVMLPLLLGDNVIGTDASCQIRLERYLHEGRCYISRRHCTLTVSLDKWLGTLRYQIRDGVVDPVEKAVKPSLNGTWLNGVLLHKTEQIDVADGGIITLGGIDQLRVSHQLIDPVMRDTYRVELTYSADQTQ